MMSTSNVSGSQLHVEFTSDIASAVLDEVLRAYEGSCLTEREVKGHLDRGGRDLVAAQLARKAMLNGTTRKEMLAFFRAEAARACDPRELEPVETLEVAHLNGLAAAIEAGHFNLKHEDTYEAVISELTGEHSSAVNVWAAVARCAFYFRVNEVLNGYEATHDLERSAEYCAREMVEGLCEAGPTGPADEFIAALAAFVDSQLSAPAA